MLKLQITQNISASRSKDKHSSYFLQNQSSVINREQHLLHLINFSVLSEIVQEQ